MGEWIIQARGSFSSTFTDRNGAAQTVSLTPGDRWTTDNACEFVSFVNGIPGAVTEQRRGLLRDAEQQCAGTAAQGNPDAPPGPTPGAGDGPPADRDDAGQQAAPQVTPQAGAGQQTTPGDGTPDPRPPAEQRHDQQAPATPGQVRDNVLGQGGTGAQADDAARRAERNEPPPGQPRTSQSGERARVPTTGGDPLELFSGAFTVLTTDLEVPTPVLPLRLVRRYASGAPYFGPWGYGWDHSYNVYLRELDDGGVALWSGELAEHVFRSTGAGFEPPRGVHERLERLTLPAVGYTATAPGGVVRRFERPGGWTDAERIPLLELRDRHGNALRFGYDAENRLARVDDLDGRGLRFGYGTCGLLELVEDHTGRQVRYQHHPEIEHLVAVTDPIGATTRYEYDERAAHPTVRHNLLRVLDPEGRTVVENAYEADPSTWSWNRVVRQVGGDYLHEYEHEQLQWVAAHEAFVDLPASRCTMRAPDGGVHVLTFNYRGDLLDQRFRLNLDGSFRVVARQWRYDAQGNQISEVDPDGGRVDFTYDAANVDPCARGNLLKVERFAPPTFFTPSRVLKQVTYEPRFQLPVTVVGEAGHGLRFVYDLDVAPGPLASGRLVRIELPDATLPDGTTQVSAVEVTTNGRGQVTLVRSPEGRAVATHHVGAGALAGFVERVVRDPAGIAEETRHAYDAHGYLARVVAPGGRVTETRRDELGRVVELVPPAIGGASVPTRYHYDADGRLIRLERPRGSYADGVLAGTHVIDEQQWSVLGFLTQQTLGVNTATPRVFRYLTCHDGRVVRAVDAMGLVSEYLHDERGLQLRELRGVGSATPVVQTDVHDRVGRLVRHVDTGGQVHLTDYDPWGRPARLTAPTGAVTHLTWGPEDRLLELRVEGDPGDGSPARVLRRERYEHDERGRRVAVRVASFRFDPATAVELVTRATFDGDDHLVAEENPRGAVGVHRFDALGRLVETRDAVGNVALHSYDGAGELARIDTTELTPAGPVARAEVFTHDARGRRTSTQTAAGAVTTYTYDDRDVLVARDEPLGVRHAFTRGLLGEALRDVHDATGLALVTERTYDAMGRELTHRDPTGRVTRWTRDPLGRAVEMELPDGQRWRWRFDAGSRVVEEETPSGSRLGYGYDPGSGLVASLACVAGAGVVAVPPHTFRHDGLGRLVEASLPGVAVARRYDGRGRLVEETTPGGTVATFFDDVAGTQELAYPDGRRERLERDAHGRATRLRVAVPGALGGVAGELLAELGYEGHARLARLAAGNGVATELTYDLERRVVRVAHVAPGGDVEVARYRYDARGRRRIASFAEAPSREVVAAMDGDDRLVAAHWDLALALGADPVTQAEHDAAIVAGEAAAGAAAASEAYGLDGSDTRTSVTRTGGGLPFEAYTSNPVHQVVTAGLEAFAYNADGARTADGSRLYEVDALGRTVRVRDAATTAVIAELGYDALGRRRVVTHGGATRTRHFVDQIWIQEDAGGPSRQRTPHPLWPVPLAFRTAATSRVAHHDAGLSIAALTDGAGAVVGRFRYQPFGEPRAFDAAGAPLANAAALGEAPVFGGMTWLDELGLFETTSRLYDPRHGAFLARDPHLYADSPNPYVFAAHNPFDHVDPDGELFWFVLGVIAVGALVGGGTNAIRQGIQLAEGSRSEFSWGELGWSTVAGGALAPAVVFAPEVTVPFLVGMGLGSSANEFSQGHIATGAFDLVTSLLPLRSGPRGAAFSPRPQWTGLWGRLGRFEGLPRNRVTHVTTPENLAAIRQSGTIRAGEIPAIEGGGRGVWVAPWRTSQLGLGRRTMTGLPTRRAYVEFEVLPGEVSRPGGIKWPFLRWQRVIPRDISLGGRRPIFGELPQPLDPTIGTLWPGLVDPLRGYRLFAPRPAQAATPPTQTVVPPPGQGGGRK